MPVERIAGVDDPRVDAYRDVLEPELVRARGLFVAEGRLVVRRVIEHGGYRLQSVLVNDAARRDLAPLVEHIAGTTPVYLCDAADFQRIAGYNIHRGCLALVERPAPLSPASLLAAARTLVVLEGMTNADNVGGIFRNAAAFDAGGVLLSPTCCDPFYRKAIRTSMGAALTVPFARCEEWPGALSQVRAAGFTIGALTPREPSESLDAFARRNRQTRIALVAGTEGAGLTAAVEAFADHRVRIPIASGVDSLNVAVAVGIALYALYPKS